MSENELYVAVLSRDELVDALTNMIDEAIRKQQVSTYDEWQNER